MRLVVAGWLNSPHVTAWASMVAELGYDVVLAGHRTRGWPPLDPPTNVAVYEEFHLGGTPVVRSLRVGEQLRRLVDRERPALVHAHWLPEYGWLAARARIHPLVSSAWGSDVLGAGWLGRRRSSLALAGSDLVLADSEPLAQATRSLAPAGSSVEVFHPGVDIERFSPADRAAARRALGWPLDAPTVLSARASGDLYNQPTVIRAFARVRALLPSARLVLRCPTGPLPTPVLETIRETGLGESVGAVGHVEAATVPDLYRAADVIVSIPSSDSSPATVWEALACGRPLVVSDLAWARDELAHGENVWLTPIDDEALAAALASLLTDEDLAGRLAEGGHRLASQTMDRRDRLRELDERYHALLS